MNTHAVKKVIAGVILQGNKVLLAQRAGPGKLCGLWEFPGGKVEEGETERECLQRELLEELAIKIEVAGYVGSSFFVDNGVNYEMKAYLVTSFIGAPVLHEHQQIKWVSLPELSCYPMPDPDKPIVDMLITNRLSSQTIKL